MVGAEVQKGGFRPEIAGLRAIAVVAVVLCHLKVAPLAGGFVGVDIFFVISGYLISKHILDEVQRSSFSFLEFYLRRARRILPALIATVVATYLIGFVWLPSDLLRGLGKEATHALLSIANIQYWREAKEYFAATSEQLPLLHTWSLSLEEQFYFVWPAAVVLAARFKVVGLTILASVIASLIAAMLVVQTDPQAAFFLMPFRIFEFCIGAAVIYAERAKIPRWASEALAAAGLSAILISLHVAQEGAWPSLMTLLPCIGTAAVIAAGSRAYASRAISSAPFLWIGAISYSLYLVHWPVIFFVRFILGPGGLTPAVSVALFGLMLAFAWASYRWVEAPFRQSRTAPKAQIWRYAGLVAGLVVITHLTFANNGFRWRLSPGQTEIATLQGFGLHPCLEVSYRHCAFGNVSSPTAMEIVGDSFSHQYVAAFDPLLKRLNLRGESSNLGGCPILVGTLLKGARLEECRKNRDEILTRIKSNNVDIVLGHAWDIYLDTNTISDFSRTDIPAGEQRSIAQLEGALDATIASVAKPGRRILLIGAQVRIPCYVDRTRLQPAPLWYAPNPRCPDVNAAEAREAGRKINEMLQRVTEKRPEMVTLLQPVDYLCDQSCPSMKEGIWLYEDSGHFTVAGAQYIGQRAEKKLLDFLQRPNTKEVRAN
ncbi:acyltransferase family protein [Tardiphaga sp. 604_B6_N1_1]|uniref:acyltransferase family protein n=1 Tax=unclassified Tardiphaga TaxID=2631404 RepID=UPI003F1FEF1F